MRRRCANATRATRLPIGPGDRGLLSAPAIDDATEPHRLAGENEVLEQSQLRHQHELLVHHADAAGEGLGRTGEGDGALVDDDGALVRPVDPLEETHQRRFAGAIAADDGVTVPRCHREVDMVVGDEGAEAARDAARAEADRRRAAGSARGIARRGSDKAAVGLLEVVGIAAVDDVPDLHFTGQDLLP